MLHLIKNILFWVYPYLLKVIIFLHTCWLNWFHLCMYKNAYRFHQFNLRWDIRWEFLFKVYNFIFNIFPSYKKVRLCVLSKIEYIILICKFLIEDSWQYLYLWVTINFVKIMTYIWFWKLSKRKRRFDFYSEFFWTGSYMKTTTPSLIKSKNDWKVSKMKLQNK